MGGGPDREHLLIVLWDPEPTGLIAQIKDKFPYIDVDYVQIKSLQANYVPPGEKGVPKGYNLLSISYLRRVSYSSQLACPDNASWHYPWQ